MLKKTIFTFPFLLICLLFINNTIHAQQVDLLEGKVLNHCYNNGKIDTSCMNTNKMTDNDDNTYITLDRIRNTVFYIFDNPVDIRGYRLFSIDGTTSARYKFEIFDNNDKSIYSVSSNYNGGTAPISWNKIYNVSLTNVKKIRLTVFPDQILLISDIKIFEKMPLENISNLKTDISYDRINFSWNNPLDENFSHVEINYNGKTKIIYGNTTTIDGLTPSIKYTFDIYSVYKDSKKSPVKKVDVLTLPKPEDIKYLTGNTTARSVNLKWGNPEKMDKVIIYRKNLKNTSSEFKIFETVGTDFEDIDVNPDTEYEYRVTTVLNGLESQGVKVRVKTKQEPPPKIEDGGFEKQPNGDYLFKWTAPKKGKVKVLIDGKDYKTVDASLLEILIPANHMKYDFLGNPKVSLVAISEDGKEGIPSKPKPIDPESGGTQTPFSVEDLIKTGFNLMWLIGPILLLALSFLLFPKFRNLVFGVFRKDGGEALHEGKDDRADRERTNPIRQERQIKRDQHVGKEYLAKLEKNNEKVMLASRVPRIPREKNYRPIRESRMPRMPRELRSGREPRRRER